MYNHHLSCRNETVHLKNHDGQVLMMKKPQDHIGLNLSGFSRSTASLSGWLTVITKINRSFRTMYFDDSYIGGNQA